MGIRNTLINLLSRDTQKSSPDNMPQSKQQLADWYETDHQNRKSERKRDYVGIPIDRALAASADITITACINFRKNQIRRIQWHLLNRDGEIITKSPFHNMLKYHHMQYHQNFFDRWMIMLLIQGNVYMEKIINPVTNLAGGIRILNSTWMDIETDIENNSIYKYEPPNLPSTEFTQSEILHDILPSYLSDIRGKSPMDRALTAVNLDRDNLLTIRSFLKNDNKPAAFLTLDPNAPHYDQAEIEEFLEYWKKQGIGTEGGYQTRFLPAPFNFHVFNMQKPDMIYSYEMANLICREFSIDPALIGVYDQTDSTNKNTTAGITQMETKFINALTSAVVPDLKHIEDFINNHILLQYLDPFNEYTFHWNYDEIDRMIRYSDTSVDQLRSDYLAGTITLNEYRRARYFPEVSEEEGGNEYTIPKGYVRITKEDRGKLAVTIDPAWLDKMMAFEAQSENTLSLAGSSSPDFNQVATASDQKPGENRYPVAE